MKILNKEFDNRIENKTARIVNTDRGRMFKKFTGNCRTIKTFFGKEKTQYEYILYCEELNGLDYTFYWHASGIYWLDKNYKDILNILSNKQT